MELNNPTKIVLCIFFAIFVTALRLQNLSDQIEQLEFVVAKIHSLVNPELPGKVPSEIIEKITKINQELQDRIQKSIKAIEEANKADNSIDKFQEDINRIYENRVKAARIFRGSSQVVPSKTLCDATFLDHIPEPKFQTIPESILNEIDIIKAVPFPPPTKPNCGEGLKFVDNIGCIGKDVNPVLVTIPPNKPNGVLGQAVPIEGQNWVYTGSVGTGVPVLAKTPNQPIITPSSANWPRRKFEYKITTNLPPPTLSLGELIIEADQRAAYLDSLFKELDLTDVISKTATIKQARNDDDANS